MNISKTINLPKINWQRSIKNFLIKYYEIKSDTYWHKIVEDFQKIFVRKATEVILNGIHIFISLYWVWSFYRILSGTYFGLWEIPFQIISFGFFSWLVRDSYRFFKKDWRVENE